MTRGRKDDFFGRNAHLAAVLRKSEFFIIIANAGDDDVAAALHKLENERAREKISVTFAAFAPQNAHFFQPHRPFLQAVEGKTAGHAVRAQHHAEALGTFSAEDLFVQLVQKRPFLAIFQSEHIKIITSTAKKVNIKSERAEISGKCNLLKYHTFRKSGHRCIKETFRILL